MGGGMRRLSRGRVLGALLVAAVLVAACSSGKKSSNNAATAQPVKLTVGTFGNFGYKQKTMDLYAEYTKAHPNVTIVEHVLDYGPHHDQLAAHLAAGSGANDVEAIDEGFINKFKGQPQNFYNLLDYGADGVKDRWLPWKWAQSLSADGKYQIGLGTDIGGLAMAYRRDLFQKAGLPTDRDQVSKLWPDWQSYFNVGKQFTAKHVGAAWFDAASNVYNAILNQSPTGYYGQDNSVVIDSNPAVKQAFDLTAQAVKDGESAKLAAFTPGWNTGMQKGTFATITLPYWMAGYIQTTAPKTAGQWDVAAVPGGGGNWGGSFLTIPKQSKHPKEAYDLIAWLTAPEQELRLFKSAAATFPSEPQLYDDPSLTSFKSSFFNNAPVGEIFAASAKTLQPQYKGAADGQIRTAVENALTRIEQGKQQPDAAWAQAVKEAKAAAASS
jgi:cellobiose transport system substrate-binding protein